MKKKIIAALIGTLLAASLAACGQGPTGTESAEPSSSSESEALTCGRWGTNNIGGGYVSCNACLPQHPPCAATQYGPLTPGYCSPGHIYCWFQKKHAGYVGVGAKLYFVPSEGWWETEVCSYNWSYCPAN